MKDLIANIIMFIANLLGAKKKEDSTVEPPMYSNEDPDIQDVNGEPVPRFTREVEPEEQEVPLTFNEEATIQPEPVVPESVEYADEESTASLGNVEEEGMVKDMFDQDAEEDMLAVGGDDALENLDILDALTKNEFSEEALLRTAEDLNVPVDQLRKTMDNMEVAAGDLSVGRGTIEAAMNPDTK